MLNDFNMHFFLSLVDHLVERLMQLHRNDCGHSSRDLQKKTATRLQQNITSNCNISMFFEHKRSH